MGKFTKNSVFYYGFYHSVLSFLMISFLVSNPAWSIENSCTSLFSEVDGTSNDLTQQIDILFNQASSGISARGFLGSYPLLSALTKEEAYSKGLMYWGIRIYVQPTIEAALEHSKGEPDTLMQGVYLIGDSAPHDAHSVAAAPFFRRLINQGLYYIENGQISRVSPGLVHLRFLPDQLEWSISEPERGFYLYQRGWFFPKNRGVLHHDFTLGSETHKKLRKLARSLYKKGFRFTFNRDFEQALRMVSQQERRGQISGSSRYNDSTFLKETIESFKLGKAFSVEVWDDSGRMVGGSLGVVSGNLYSPDSVFYDNQNYKNGIDFAKISVLALIQRLHETGIHFVDAGMVTHFTASVKGKYVPGEEFLSLIKSLPAAKNWPDFSSEWIP